MQPLANSFIKDSNEDERRYPLSLVFCSNCGLVQTDYVVPPEEMFRSYFWVSGTSDTIPVHFHELAEEAVKIVGAEQGSLVIDIGSNDGTLLKGFKTLGMKVLGIEPAKNIAEIAHKNGISTVNEFFNSDTARRISSGNGKAKIITATNVFAHVDDVFNLLEGVKTLLQDDGIFLIEVPYLMDMISKNEFDTAYHEHLSYFSVKPLVYLFKAAGMEISDVKRNTVHGGTIRVYAKKKTSSATVSDSVEKLMKLEDEAGLNSIDTYLKFAERVYNLKGELNSVLRRLKSEGKTVIGYGAPAKGNTLLNFFNVGPNELDYIADKNPLKHGVYTPGMHIPVVPVDKIPNTKPDYMLILAWNFSDEIMRQQENFRDSGGKFIIPIPKVRIL